MLVAGELDAAPINRVFSRESNIIDRSTQIRAQGADWSKVKPLFADRIAEGVRYFRKTGIYPINHGVVIKDSLLKDMPWIAGELLRMFEAAKTEYLKNLRASGDVSSWDKAAADNAAVVGDPFPFGIENNRKTLEAITQFALDQKMVPRKFSVEELFTPVH